MFFSQQIAYELCFDGIVNQINMYLKTRVNQNNNHMFYEFLKMHKSVDNTIETIFRFIQIVWKVE